MMEDRSKELNASGSPVEQRHMEAFQPSRSVLPVSHPPLDDSPKTARLLPRTSSSSNPMAPTSPSTSHPDSSSDPPPPPPYRFRSSPSSVPTRSTSFPDFPSPSSSPPTSVRRPAPSHTSLLPSSSSPLRPTPGRQHSQPRPRVEVLEQLSRCASISLEEQQQSRVVLGKMTRSLGILAASMQDLVESQREFAHDSLKMQREMLDTLRQFSASALTLLRDKVDGHPPL